MAYEARAKKEFPRQRALYIKIYDFDLREVYAHQDVAAVIAETAAEYVHAAGMTRVVGNADPETDRGMLADGQVVDSDIRRGDAIDEGALLRYPPRLQLSIL